MKSDPEKNHLDCLATIPSSDVNFKGALASASVNTLQVALETNQNLSKTRYNAVGAELRRRAREAGQPAPNIPAFSKIIPPAVPAASSKPSDEPVASVDESAADETTSDDPTDEADGEDPDENAHYNEEIEEEDDEQPVSPAPQRPPIPVPLQAVGISLGRLRAALPGLASTMMRGRGHLGVLTSVLVECSGGRIALRTTDLDVWTSVEVRPFDPLPTTPLAVKLVGLRHQRTNGAVLVPLSRLQNIAKVADKEGELLISRADSTTIRLHYPAVGTMAEEMFAEMDTRDFPEPPEAEEVVATLAFNAEVREAVKDALRCVSEDETREVLTGVYFDAQQPDRHFVLSCDGRRLIRSCPFLFEQLTASFILPANKSVEFLLKNGADWTLRASEYWLWVQSGDWQVTMRRIPGTYPSWRRVIPTYRQPAALVLSMDEAAAARACQVISSLPVSNDRIGVTINADGARKSAWVECNGASVPLPGCAVSGRGRVGLHPKFLSDALRLGLHDRIEIHTEQDPVQFWGSNHRYMVLMPMRLSA